MRIGTILKEISKTSLVSLPVDGAIKIEDLLTENEVCATLHLSTWILEHVRKNVLVNENKTKKFSVWKYRSLFVIKLFWLKIFIWRYIGSLVFEILKL